MRNIKFLIDNKNGVGLCLKDVICENIWNKFIENGKIILTENEGQ